MHIDGTLIRWNDERGFGFIASTTSGKEFFVHLSSFPRDGRRPTLNERLSFEIEQNNEGKARAVHVRRPPGPLSAPTHRSENVVGQPKRALFGLAATIALILGLGVYAYTTISHLSAPSSPAVESLSAQEAPARLSQSFDARCDGRTRCSQMTSCDEAKFFLKNCPGVQMDGDNDGVPCEQQWCSAE